VAAVTPLLNDSDSVNQVWAANALADFEQINTAVNHLTELLKGEAKNWAAAGLMHLGPESRSAVPLLIEMLETRKDAHEGYAACTALAAIGRDAASALPALKAASTDPDKYIRDAAIHAIREIDGR
jgi:HEAT repeat protein